MDEVETIRGLNWEQLAELWAGVQAGTTPGWEPGRAFEFLFLRMFELDGAAVTWPYTVDMEGEVVEQLDGAIHVAGLSFIVESKDWYQNVPIEAIAKLKYRLFRRPPATMGLVASAKGFTSAARVMSLYSMPQNVILWTGSDIKYALKVRRPVDILVRKYRYCVEHGIPDRFIFLGGPT